jgi:NAD(P) transhydrogenase subunit alpha
MKIGIPKETHPGERRVAATPETVQRLRKMGFDVLVESKAGDSADYSDAAYAEAGAEIVTDVGRLWREPDLVAKVRPPGVNEALGMYEADLLREGARFISFLAPAQNGPLLALLASRRITAFSMDCVPRITRAQRMDALSAMANIAGYRAVIEASHAFPQFFAGQITAAGKVQPAKVLVIGAGVAGLAAIGAAKGLGAIVRAFDTRLEVREQIQSMGAEFLVLDFKESGEGEGGYAKVMSDEFLAAEMALFAKQAIDVDIIITTALIPGKEAPKLITAGMVESMKEGSVIVDLAAEQGGNCALTVPGEKIVHSGVTIIGYTDLPSRMARLSSQLYGTTVANLIDELGGAAAFRIDHDNEVIRGALVLEDGRMMWPPPKPKPPEKPMVAERRDSVDLPVQPLAPKKPAHGHGASRASGAGGTLGLAIAGVALLIVGSLAPETDGGAFLSHLTVFILACFIGWQVVWNVTPALHTPLMSVTNAISGIIIVGGMLQVSDGSFSATMILGSIAIFIATINIAGGFLVTKRMLAMFHR